MSLSLAICDIVVIVLRRFSKVLMRDQPVSPGECSSRRRDESSGSSSSVRLADLSGCPLQEREMQNMSASQHQQSRTNTF